MRPHTFPLLAILGLSATSAFAQSGGDASDLFLNAFMAFQKGEKAEGTGDTGAAVKAYNQAISNLDQLSQRWPAWQPPIVKYRRDRAAAALEKLQAKMRPDDNPLNGPPVPDNGVLPSDTTFPEPPGTKGTSRKGKSAPPANADGALEQIQNQIQTLKSNLEKTREDLDKATREKETYAKQLEEAQKEAKKRAQELDVVKSRADRAEKALVEAEKSGGTNDEQLAALRAEVAKTRQHMRQLEFERDAEAEIRDQISSRAATANRKAETLANERDNAVKLGAEAPKKIAEMQKEIDRVLREKGDLETRLAKVEGQLKEVTSQRDEAVQQVTKMREASKNVDKLLADNTALMSKLADAEKQVTALKSDGVKKDDEIKRLNGEVTSVRKQLAEAQQQSAQYQTQMADLHKQLDSQAKELALVKADVTKSTAERERLVKENDLLRGIVLRAQKAQADKEQVKKLVLDQLAKLDTNSKALSTQIELLGSPVVKLTEKEKSLFKQPVLSIGDAEVSLGAPKENTVAPSTPAKPPEIASVPTPPTAPPPEEKPSEPTVGVATPQPPKAPDVPPAKAEPPKVAETTPVPPAKPEKPESLTLDTPLPDELNPLIGAGNSKPKGKIDPLASNTQKPGLPGKPTKGSPGASLEPELPAKESPDQQAEMLPGAGAKSGEPAVPPDLIGLARDAKDQFERGNYREAEKTYDKAIAKAPNNLYLLSNRGVVLFRAQKYKLAEESFKKAIAIAPEDDFSHCTLGIIYYSMGKFDDAINELTKALAINPKNATAHNYLGITASQKGWQEAAQKELETATAIDPNYADAHFNLAVVFATQTPPNKEAARQHYKRAIELGAEPDAGLEQLIK